MLYRYAVAAPLLLVLAFTTVAAARVLFVFNPPPVTYTTETTRDQYRLLDGRKSNGISTTVTIEHRLEPTAQGYTVTTKPISFVAKQQDKVTQNKAAELMATVPYVLKLNEMGEAQEATGYERLPSMVDSVFDSTAAAAIKSRLDVQRMAAMPVSEWNGRNGFRSSSEGDVGEMLYDKAEYQLPGGPEVMYYTAKQITDTLQVDGQWCARLVIQADSNPDSLASAIGLPVEKIKDAYALTDDQRAQAMSNEFRLHSRVELVWEMKTGLMHAEKIDRHVSRTMSRGGVTSTMETVEVESTSYRYQPRY